MSNSFKNRVAIMQSIEPSLNSVLSTYTRPVEEYWQPSEFLPDSSNDHFWDDVKDLQEKAKSIDDDVFAVLIGDTITEEALPTYETWLMDTEGIDQDEESHWTQWVRSWTAEENRHGDLLHKYLYLSGRVNMRAMEISTQHLIKDGFHIQTGRDPYRSFVYTSFQELATNVSHRRVATLAKKTGDERLAKICSIIAGDEARHARVYMTFVSKLFELDASEMMMAFSDMMKKKIVMPAHFLREAGGKMGDLFTHFSNAAQRTNVYTTHDYIDILKQLLDKWNIEKVSGLSDQAQKARDYVMALPDRLTRLAERMTVPQDRYLFSWLITTHS